MKWKDLVRFLSSGGQWKLTQKAYISIYGFYATMVHNYLCPGHLSSLITDLINSTHDSRFCPRATVRKVLAGSFKARPSLLSHHSVRLSFCSPWPSPLSCSYLTRFWLYPLFLSSSFVMCFPPNQGLTSCHSPRQHPRSG